MIYFTSSKGYRPGGQNGVNLKTGVVDPPYGPESVLQHEAGIKSDWSLLGIPIRTNIDFWYQDYTNIQELLLDSNGDGRRANAGHAHLWGDDVEVMAELRRAVEVGLNYGHGTIKYVSFLPGVQAGDIANLQTARTLNFPPNKVSAFVEYRHSLRSGMGDVRLRATYSWQDTSGDTQVPNQLGMIKAFGLLNLNAEWNALFGKPADLRFYVSNATNREYATSPVPFWQPAFFGFGLSHYGEPRLYGVRLTYHFGNE